MSSNNKQGDIVQRLKIAAAETETLKNELKQGKGQAYGDLSIDFSAKYQMLMDEAEKEIADEYKSTGTLTSARICEINRGMDDYALSIQDVMMLMDNCQDKE